MYAAPLAEVKVTRGGQYGGLRKHKGLDLVAAPGTPVRAVIGGLVVDWGTSDVHGFWGMWQGDDGVFHNVQHLLMPFAMRGRIEAGQIIALSGGTGATTGPHLHEGMSTQASLTVGTIDPTTIILTAPQPTQPSRSSMYALVPPDPPATTGYRMVYLGCLSSSGTIISIPITPTEWMPLVRVLTQQALQAGDNALWNSKIIALLGQVPAGGSGGGLTPAQDAKLMAIPSADSDTVDEPELGGALTSAVSLINANSNANTVSIIDKINGLSLNHG